MQASVLTPEDQPLPENTTLWSVDEPSRLRGAGIQSYYSHTKQEHVLHFSLKDHKHLHKHQTSEHLHQQHPHISPVLSWESSAGGRLASLCPRSVVAPRTPQQCDSSRLQPSDTRTREDGDSIRTLWRFGPAMHPPQH